MKWPRVRIFDVMGWVALVAVNCVIFRVLADPNMSNSLHIAALSFAMTGSLVMVACVAMARGIRLAGEARPFQVGFVAFALSGDDGIVRVDVLGRHDFQLYRIRHDADRARLDALAGRRAPGAEPAIGLRA